mgnify:CR=1 FL=1
MNVASKHVLTGGKGVVKIWNVGSELDALDQFEKEKNELKEESDLEKLSEALINNNNNI